MTSEEVELLKGWIDEKFLLRDERASALQTEMRTLQQDVKGLQVNVAALEREMGDFRDVAADLKDVAHHLEQVKDAFGPVQKLASFVLAKKTWAAFATVMLVINWIADHIQLFDPLWPF